jgi:maleamate amidohydrolase
VVARDDISDRALAPHEASLFDMAQKSADVLSCAEIAAQLRDIK